MLVNHNVLIRWARDTSFDWMHSLSHLRQALKPATGRRCCGGRMPAVDASVFNKVADSPVFKAELARVRKQLRQPLNIAVGNQRFLIV